MTTQISRISKPSFQMQKSPSPTSAVPNYNVCPHCKQEVCEDYCNLHGMIISMKSAVVNRFYPQELRFMGVLQ